MSTGVEVMSVMDSARAHHHVPQPIKPATDISDFQDVSYLFVHYVIF